VDVEIILDEHDGLGVGKMDVGQVLEELGIIGRGMAIGHFDVAPAFEWCEQHEKIGSAVAFVLVIMTGRRPVSSGRGMRVSAISCFELSSRQTSGRSGSCGRV
jgi:hypothetical protein